MIYALVYLIIAVLVHNVVLVTRIDEKFFRDRKRGGEIIARTLITGIFWPLYLLRFLLRSFAMGVIIIMSLPTILYIFLLSIHARRKT